MLLTSFFTHLLPDEMENYLSEIRRILAPGGRCLASFFLLNEGSLETIRSGTSTIDFRHDFGGYRVKDVDTPEAAIAFSEDYVRSLYAELGLGIIEPVSYRSWRGRRDFLSYQDIVVAVKEETPQELLSASHSDIRFVYSGRNDNLASALPHMRSILEFPANPESKRTGLRALRKNVESPAWANACVRGRVCCCSWASFAW